MTGDPNTSALASQPVPQEEKPWVDQWLMEWGQLGAAHVDAYLARVAAALGIRPAGHERPARMAPRHT